VYMSTSSGSVTFRWVAEQFFEPGTAPKDQLPVTFAVTLHSDGRLDLVYGPGNNRGLRQGSSTPVVGVADGGCSTFLLDGYSGSDTLTNAPAVTLLPSSGEDHNRPTISGTAPIMREGTPAQFTVTAAAPDDLPVTITASLPRGATFDPATG